MIILYRYIKKKQKEKAEREEQAQREKDESDELSPTQSQTDNAIARQPPKQPEQSLAPTASDSDSPKPKAKVDWVWRIKMAVALIIPIFLETLDYTVVATAQTKIASDFNRLDLQSYIGTAYLLTSTVFLPFFATLADLYGRHFALQTSLFFFLVGSAISTAAQNMPMMLAGRGVAGIGAAGMLEVVRVIMADSSSLDENNWQMMVMFILYAIGFSTGPVIGGELIKISFRWVFGINLPATALGMILAFLLIRKGVKGAQEIKLPHGAQDFLSRFLCIDWVGTFFFVAGGILVLLALNWGSSDGWNAPRVIASFIIGGILFIACLAWEYLLERHELAPSPSSNRLLSAFPMLPLDVFRHYDVIAVQYCSFVGGMIMLVMFYFVAIFITIVDELPPDKAGVQLLYFAPGMGAGSFISMRIIAWTRQPRYAIMVGNLILPVGLGLVAMSTENSNQAMLDGFLALTGVGIGMQLGPIAVQARFCMDAKRVAIVSALTLFFRSFGGTVGLAQCGAVLNGKVRAIISDAIASGQIPNVDLGSSVGDGLSSISDLQQLPPEVADIIKNAFKEGTRWAFISLIPWAAICPFLSIFMSNIDMSRHKIAEKRQNDDDLRLQDSAV